MRTHRQNWLDVFSGFRVALDLKKMLLGALGALISFAVLLGMLRLSAHWYPGAETHIYKLVMQSPLESVPDLHCAIAAKFNGTQGFRECAFLLGGGFIMLFIWSFFGGAIARLAAVDFAKDERLSIAEATDFSLKKFGSFFWSPIVPFIFVALFLLCNYVLGLVGHISTVGPAIVGIFFFLAILSSFLSLLLIIGGALGFPFMWPTIAMEGTDSFDAISRAFNYLFARPWKTLWCWFVAVAYGVVVTAFVGWFTCAMIWLTQWSVMSGMGKPTCDLRALIMDASSAEMVGIWLMIVLCVIIGGLFVGFVASYKITAMTIIYAVLRRDVDGTDMSEVYLPEEEQPAESASAPAEAGATPPSGAA